MNNSASVSLPDRDLVLIGAGHTNLHVVRMWRTQPIEDVRLTLVSPFSRATYSGMLPGVLAGLYPPDAMEIDLWRLCESCGVRLVVAEANGLDSARQYVLLADRPPLRYDVASIGIGSVPTAHDLCSAHPGVLSIKPMATFRERFEKRLAAVLAGKRFGKGTLDSPERPVTQKRNPHDLEQIRVAIVGAGAGGTEVALGLDAQLRARGIRIAVSLIDGGAEILRGYSPGTIRRARQELQRRAVSVRLGSRVAAVAEGQGGHCAELVFDDGSRQLAEITIWATAAAPPPVLAGFDLPKADDGFLVVHPTLQTTADLPVFVVGDTAGIVGEPIPRAGVYAVREGPILWENLQRILDGRTLRTYKPQRGFLSLLSTGDGRALLDYRGFSSHSQWAWKLKDHIDRKFMRMYRDYRPRETMTGRSRSGASSRRGIDGRSTPPMRCAGCGSKLGAGALNAALDRLDIPQSTATSSKHAGRDDAVVLDRQTAPVDVLSVDFFPAFLDDPYLIGRIAALHALSDVWAMGADPLGGLALVTIPAGPESQQAELLYQLLAGGVRELTAAGATLWGGHTTEGDVLTLGYNVAGNLGGRAPFAKGKLRAGDRLILTKPLGTATLLAAHRECRCEARWLDAMLVHMLESNAVAAKAAREFDVEAATDVTGFGLVGHLLEMLSASGIAARLSLSAIPLLDGFSALSEKGFRSSLDPANRQATARMRTVDKAAVSHSAFQALFDPQTSGGMLIAVSQDRAEALRRRLLASGCAATAIVGEIIPVREGPDIEIAP